MDSNNMSVDSPMGGMAMQQRDIKPDLTQLGVATGPGGFGGQGQGFNASQGQVFNPVGTSQPDQRYSAPSTTQPGYFGMGQGMPSHPDMAGPLQSPTLHSPSSGMMASPGSMTSPMQSPGGNLTPLQSPTSTMSMSSPAGNMGMPMSLQGPTHAHSSLSTKHICAICGDRASGKHYGVYRYVSVYYTQQTRGNHPMLFQCWTSVEDGEPTLEQHWVNALCLLDRIWLANRIYLWVTSLLFLLTNRRL